MNHCERLSVISAVMLFKFALSPTSGAFFGLAGPASGGHLSVFDAVAGVDPEIGSIVAVLLGESYGDVLVNEFDAVHVRCSLVMSLI